MSHVRDAEPEVALGHLHYQVWVLCEIKKLGGYQFIKSRLGLAMNCSAKNCTQLSVKATEKAAA